MKFILNEEVILKNTTLVGRIIDIWITEINTNRHDTKIGVEFSNKIPGGHSCRGNGSPEKCLYFNDWELISRATISN